MNYLQQLAPDQKEVIEQFFIEYSDSLPELKAEGKDHCEAGMEAVIALLYRLATNKSTSWDINLPIYQQMAYRVGYNYLARWPNVNLNHSYSVRLFKVFELLDEKIWESPLAHNMKSILDEYYEETSIVPQHLL